MLPLTPPKIKSYVTENNPVRVIEAFIDELDLTVLGFEGAVPAVTGRPACCDPAQDLPIRLSQPHPVEPAAGTGDPA
jgi:hypothetical protein